ANPGFVPPPSSMPYPGTSGSSQAMQWGFGTYQQPPPQLSAIVTSPSNQSKQPYQDIRFDPSTNQSFTQPSTGAPYGTPQMPPNVHTTPQPMNIKTEPGYPAPVYTPQGQNQIQQTFTPQQTPNLRPQSKSEWLPKSLYFDPSKTTWEAFYLKFHNYARDKRWTSEDCKSNLMYVLEGKAAEFFASLHEREPNLPFYDVVSRMETRFAFRELQETSQLEFLNCNQKKDEKVEEWADRVLTLATKAYRNLPDDHIQRQAVMRFCHGSYDKNAGMHAANKMPSRMEEAITCVKWFQYNHLIFQDKSRERRSVHQMGESYPYDFPDSHVQAATLHDSRLLSQYDFAGGMQDMSIRATSVQSSLPIAQNGESRGRQQERYVSYRGSRHNSPATEKREEKSKFGLPEKSTEQRLADLEKNFQKLLDKLLQKTDDSSSNRRPRSPSPSRAGGRFGRSESPLRCFGCNKEGHFKRDCPEAKHVSFNVKSVSQDDLNESGSGWEA
ncbi:MAG: zinc finger domain-containing protein, partial [Candidatus Thiodiazotropha taylori]|nr:zinc finger domain-containing protein [Candidatus Thiodiazotropha taylori]